MPISGLDAQFAHRQHAGSHARIMPSAGKKKTVSGQIVGQIIYLCPFLKLVIKNNIFFMQCKSSTGGDRIKLSQCYMWYN